MTGDQAMHAIATVHPNNRYPMPLPPSASRTPVPIHMRDVKYRGYAREDGMWDVEAELIDQKTYDIELHGERKVPAGKPIHHMWIRLTIDADMVVHGIEAAMDDHPLGHCPEATKSMQKMLGCCIARGWRRRRQPGRRGGLHAPARAAVQHGHPRFSHRAQSVRHR